MSYPKLQNYMANVRKPNVFNFGMFPTGQDVTWIDGDAGGGASGVPIYTDFTSQVNGVQANFVLPSAPSPDPDSALAVYVNGARLKRTVGFSISGTTITLSIVPQIGDYVWTYHYA
jgi:hypothetical protein